MKSDVAQGSGMALERALQILGPEKVITVETAAKAWGLGQPAVTPPIRYSEAALMQATQENQTGEHDWRLIYIFGESLRRLRELVGLVGTDSDTQPCFWDNGWWLTTANDSWATNQPEAGYYLLDLSGRWQNQTWDDQQTELEKLGDQFERANPAIFTEACLTIFKASGDRKERIAENWYHWSAVVGSISYFVVVGSFDALGWNVYVSPRGFSDWNLRVVVLRKS